MLIEFFVVGGFAFWALMAALTIVLFYCMDRDWGLGATGALLITGGLIALFGDFNVFKWVIHNKLLAITYGGGYVAAGIVWSFFKWIIWGRERAGKVNEFKADWIAANKRPTLEDQKLTEDELESMTAQQQEDRKYELLNSALEKYQTRYMEAADRAGYVETTRKGKQTTIPQFARNHKRRVVMWASYWPFSFVWTFADDVVTAFIKGVVTTLGNQYQAVMNGLFKGTDSVA